MRTIKPSGVLNIAETVGGWNIVRVSAGPDSEPIILSSEYPLYVREESPVHLRFLEYSPSHPNRYRIHQCADELNVITITEAGHFNHAQPLGFNRWLLVRSLADGDSDENACVYTSEGEPVQWFHAGAWVDKVQVSRDGQIWLGYSDEGVLKNYSCLSQNGIVCLNDTGKPILEYSELVKQHGLPPAYDCYAINVVSDEEVWLYYYEDFPLVRLKNRRLENIWRDIPIKGSGGLSVWRDWVLLARTYPSRTQNSRFNFFLLSLETMQVEELQPTDENGQPIEFYKPVFGRGSRLYVMKEHSLYWFDLQNIVEAS